MIQVTIYAQIKLTKTQLAALQQLDASGCKPDSMSWLHLNPRTARFLRDQGLVTYRERTLGSGRVEYNGSALTHCGCLVLESLDRDETLAA